MKPADAARIFGEMDVDLRRRGCSRGCGPRSPAAILTGMEADAAYAITLTIASRNANVPDE